MNIGLNFLRTNWETNVLDRLRAYASAAPGLFFYFCALNAVVQSETTDGKVNALVSVSLAFVVSNEKQTETAILYNFAILYRMCRNFLPFRFMWKLCDR